ncbi:MAG: hypothetical protein ABSC76_05970 [Terracidiphilus sp.]|jgi:hypothetical protein
MLRRILKVVSGSSLCHEDQEIVRHSIIGGLVAIALVGLHQLGEWQASRWTKSSTEPIRIAGQIVGWVVVFVVVFAAIMFVEQYIRRLQWTAKILLDDVGFIDGQWIEVVVMNGEVAGAGVFMISSTQGEGFQLNGKTYHVVDEKNIDLDKVSSWRANGGTPIGGDGVAYFFKGFTASGRDHSGVGLKRFVIHGATDLTYGGSFLSEQESSAFHTIGRRISQDSLPEGDALAILKDFLNHSEVHDFVTNRRFEIRNPAAT